MTANDKTHAQKKSVMFWGQRSSDVQKMSTSQMFKPQSTGRVRVFTLWLARNGQEKTNKRKENPRSEREIQGAADGQHEEGKYALRLMRVATPTAGA